MLYYKKIVTFLILLQGLGFVCMAQDKRNTITVSQYREHKLVYLAEIQSLRSTHGTFFNGISGNICRRISSRILLGAGLEFASCPYHEDNRAELRRLRFLPLVADVKYQFKQTGTFTPFVQLSEGISFIRYNKQDEATGKKPYRISEKGDYAYLGVGTAINLSNHFIPILGIGLKGFHMSTNVLDVNPHGLSFRVGYIFRHGSSI